MKQPKVPNTITDAQMADLSRRAQKANPHMFTDEAIRLLKADVAQRRKADQS